MSKLSDNDHRLKLLKQQRAQARHDLREKRAAFRLAKLEFESAVNELHRIEKMIRLLESRVYDDYGIFVYGDEGASS
jgi:hypothetical protein